MESKLEGKVNVRIEEDLRKVFENDEDFESTV